MWMWYLLNTLKNGKHEFHMSSGASPTGALSVIDWLVPSGVWVKRCHVWVRLVPSVGQTGATCGSDWCRLWVRLVPSMGQTGATCGSDRYHVWVRLVPRVGQTGAIRRVSEAVPRVGQTGAICGSDWCHMWVRLVPSVGQTGATCGSDWCHLWVRRATCGSGARLWKNLTNILWGFSYLRGC